jgi:predicted amidophosphoribosyltransferase
MDNRERMRLYMAHLRQMRRAKGLCPRCGDPLQFGERNCEECRRVRRIERGGFPVAHHPSTHVA